MSKTGKTLKRYWIEVRGSAGHEVTAHSAGAARWREYVAYQDAFGLLPFLEFLERIEVFHHLGKVEPQP